MSEQFRKPLVWVGASLLILLITSGAASAQNTILLSPGTGTIRTGDGFSLGTTFTVGANDETVTDLGVWDGPNGNNGSIGDGLITSIPVGLFDSAGTLIANVTVPFGTTGTLLNGFRYSPITPVNLLSGNTYTLAAYYTAQDADVLHDQGGAPSTSADFNNYLAAFTGSNTVGSLSFPTGHTNGTAYVGPNFEYTSTAVPEPATLPLVISGLSVLGVFRRRR